MWGRNGVLCCFLVLCLWACLNAVPVAVDKTKVSPPAEELEPPKSAVRNMSTDMKIVRLPVRQHTRNSDAV